MGADVVLLLQGGAAADAFSKGDAGDLEAAYAACKARAVERWMLCVVGLFSCCCAGTVHYCRGEPGLNYLISMAEGGVHEN